MIGRKQIRIWAIVLVLIAGAVAGVGTGSASENSHQLWAASPALTVSSGSQAFTVSPDGSRLFVTGSIPGAGLRDYGIIAYDAESGAEIWAARYDGPTNGSDVARAVVVSRDGSKVFVTGSSTGPADRTDIATVAYSAVSGEQLWASRYNGPDDFIDAAKAIALSPDGEKVFVSGLTYGYGLINYLTVAYAADGGGQLWAESYNGSFNYHDTVEAMAVSPDGSKVFVTGSSYVHNGYVDYVTIAYAASNGQQLWLSTYGGSANQFDTPRSVAASPDGSKVFVTGVAHGANNGDYATVAYSADTGRQEWASTYDGAGYYDDAKALAVSPDGSALFVTGRSSSMTSSDYATVAYSADDGARLWATRYNALFDSYDLATSLAVSPDGSRLYVTGYSDYDFVTVAYTSIGMRLWTSRYKGDFYSYTRAIAVSPDGMKIFVTGSSYARDSSQKTITIAYRSNTCDSGKNESGSLSGLIHDPLESEVDNHLVHSLSCEVLVEEGL